MKFWLDIYWIALYGTRRGLFGDTLGGTLAGHVMDNLSYCLGHGEDAFGTYYTGIGRTCDRQLKLVDWTQIRHFATMLDDILAPTKYGRHWMVHCADAFGTP